MGVSTLLMALLGLGAAHVFWQAYGHWAKVNKPFTLDSTQPHTNSKITNDIDYAQGIGSAHLFGWLLVTNNQPSINYYLLSTINNKNQ